MNEYQIQYTDNSYRVIDWTQEEFEQVGQAMGKGLNVLVLERGIFSLIDIRTIVLIPEEEQKETETNNDERIEIDQRTAEWLGTMGIDLRGANL